VSHSAGPGRPRLTAVPDPGPGEGPARFAAPAPPNGVQRRWVWLLGALLVLSLLGFAMEARRAGRLAQELAASQARADAAEARLTAYDAYLAAVRERAGALRQAVDGLAGALAADPADGRPRE
jgi:hypothetical protein